MDEKKEYPGKALTQRAKSAVQGAVDKGAGKPAPDFFKKAASSFGEIADRAATALGDSFPPDMGSAPSSFKGSAIKTPQSWAAPPQPVNRPAKTPQDRQFGVTPPGRGSVQRHGFGQSGTGTFTLPGQQFQNKDKVAQGEQVLIGRLPGETQNFEKWAFNKQQQAQGSAGLTTSADGKTWAIKTSAGPDYSALFAKQNDDLFAASMAAFRRGDHPSQLRGAAPDASASGQGMGVSPDLWKQRQEILDRINFQSMGSGGSSIDSIIKREFGLKPLRNQLNSVDELIKAQMGLQAATGKPTKAEEDPAVKDSRQHANAKELKMMELAGQAGLESLKQEGAAANRAPDRNYEKEAKTKGRYDLLTALIKSKEGSGEEVDPQKLGSIITQLEEIVGDDFTEKFLDSLK